MPDAFTTTTNFGPGKQLVPKPEDFEDFRHELAAPETGHSEDEQAPPLDEPDQEDIS